MSEIPANAMDTSAILPNESIRGIKKDIFCNRGFEISTWRTVVSKNNENMLAQRSRPKKLISPMSLRKEAENMVLRSTISKKAHEALQASKEVAVIISRKKFISWRAEHIPKKNGTTKKKTLHDDEKNIEENRILK